MTVGSYSQTTVCPEALVPGHVYDLEYWGLAKQRGHDYPVARPAIFLGRERSRRAECGREAYVFLAWLEKGIRRSWVYTSDDGFVSRCGYPVRVCGGDETLPNCDRFTAHGISLRMTNAGFHVWALEHDGCVGYLIESGFTWAKSWLWGVFTRGQDHRSWRVIDNGFTWKRDDAFAAMLAVLAPSSHDRMSLVCRGDCTPA